MFLKQFPVLNSWETLFAEFILITLVNVHLQHIVSMNYSMVIIADAAYRLHRPKIQSAWIGSKLQHFGCSQVSTRHPHQILNHLYVLDFLQSTYWSWYLLLCRSDQAGCGQRSCFLNAVSHIFGRWLFHISDTFSQSVAALKNIFPPVLASALWNLSCVNISCCLQKAAFFPEG